MRRLPSEDVSRESDASDAASNADADADANARATVSAAERARVRELRRQIAAGEYRPDPEAIARRIVRSGDLGGVDAAAPDPPAPTARRLQLVAQPNEDPSDPDDPDQPDEAGRDEAVGDEAGRDEAGRDGG